jgi:glutamate dehydrogenase/leucine dehydrogenase
VKVHQLESTDAFVVFDLDAAGASAGVARLAPKVLRDGAELLARSATYTYAVFGVEGWAGASAGINAKDDGRAAAIAAFTAELAPLSVAGTVHLQPGVGLTAGDLAPLNGTAPDPNLLAEGAVAAANAVFDGLGGAHVVITGAPAAMSDALQRALQARGATQIATGDASTGCDVLFIGGKAGALDHEAAEAVTARVVAPVSTVPVTARAYAVLRKAGRTYVPDFISTAAPLLAQAGQAEPAVTIERVAAELAPAGETMFMDAVERAEAFLSTWQDEKPFGRPLS